MTYQKQKIQKYINKHVDVDDLFNRDLNETIEKLQAIKEEFGENLYIAVDAEEDDGSYVVITLYDQVLETDEEFQTRVNLARKQEEYYRKATEEREKNQLATLIQKYGVPKE